MQCPTNTNGYRRIYSLRILLLMLQKTPFLWNIRIVQNKPKNDTVYLYQNNLYPCSKIYIVFLFLSSSSVLRSCSFIKTSVINGYSCAAWYGFYTMSIWKWFIIDVRMHCRLCCPYVWPWLYVWPSIISPMLIFPILNVVITVSVPPHPSVFVIVWTPHLRRIKHRQK